MKILIAVDSFKGSLSSEEAGSAIASGIGKVFPEALTTVVPIADGGEGTVQALITAGKGKLVHTQVTSPIGEKLEADFGLMPDGTAVLEMAAASGLTLIPAEKRNPLVTTTFGTGELIRKALDLGAKTIVIGIGGSATNDGGVGMAEALGVKFLDKANNPLPYGGGALDALASIDISGLDPRISTTTIKVICDVDNPLCGERGASKVYGPQKGASSEMVEHLDKNLQHLAHVIKAQLNKDVINLPGAGAAGGLGAGLIAFLDGELQPGVEVILDTINFDTLIQQYDLVITGEGRIDKQSCYGKVPSGVAKRAKKHNVPCIAFAGSIGEEFEKLYDHGIAAIVPIVDKPMPLEEAMQNAKQLTTQAAQRTFQLIKLGKSIDSV